MGERLPPKTTRDPTSEVEVEPDTGQTALPRVAPPGSPLGARDRKPSVPPPPPNVVKNASGAPGPPPAGPPPPPPSRSRMPAARNGDDDTTGGGRPARMPESATPEPAVMLGSDAITPAPGSAPLHEQPTRIVGAAELSGKDGGPPPPPR